MSVFDTPELSGKLRVSNTGDILLPLVGTLHVQGMKAEEAQNLIRQKFITGGFVKDPQVTLFIAEYATQGVSVVGEVKNPGVYPAFGSHHLLDYISLAQGLTPLAGSRITITHVGKSDEPQHVKITAGATPKPENNPEILPGDTIYVERTGIVYVIGDVARSGGFPMDHDEQLSILQAVALAQGTNSTAARRAQSGSSAPPPMAVLEIPVNLKKILSSKEHRSRDAGQRHPLRPQQCREECAEGYGSRSYQLLPRAIYQDALTQNPVMFHVEHLVHYLIAILRNKPARDWIVCACHIESSIVNRYDCTRIT